MGPFCLLSNGLGASWTSWVLLKEFKIVNDPFDITVKFSFERIELLSEESEPSTIIKSYYRLLPDLANQEITERQNELEKLLPNYEVAYLAADSAEMAEVRTLIDDRWAKIHFLHSQFFNTEVVSILNTAYVAMFGNLLPENFSSEGEK